MTVQTLMNTHSDADQDIRSAIIQRCSLNDDALAHIGRLQDSLSVGFSDAAICLRYATQADVDSASGSPPSHPPIASDRIAVPAERLIINHQPSHPRSEKIRLLRTELLLRHEESDKANIISVLSPCSGEGRSQLAAELAISFSQLGRPTLLVDADLRKPQQHILFKIDNKKGLAQSLIRAQAPHYRTVKGLPNLLLLTSGDLPPNPLELLSDQSFEEMVDGWQRSFQYVVLDTPPVGRYADGLAVATIIGRVLSISRASHTPYRETRNMMRRLAATRSRVLGAVINYF